MFRRRIPLPYHRRVLAFFWPRRGWRRASLYVAHRVRRLPGSPDHIAAGFACGAAVSFTPFVGAHFLCAALLALVLRGNIVASAIGTVVGNPWTFPFIWAWIYMLGNWLLGGEAATDLPAVLSFHYIFDRPLDVLWPMTVGGVPTAVVVWFAFFWPIRGMVAEYQRARRWRIRRRANKRRASRQAANAAGREAEAKEP